MTIQHLIVISFLLLSLYTLTNATLEQDEEIEFGNPIDPESLGLKKEPNLTHFRFYWQEILGGENPSTIEIVPPVPKYNSTTSFGMVRVLDNKLTIGPEVSSKVIGKAEGTYTLTSQTDLDLLMVQNFVFFEGRYNGSTITILGRNPLNETVREMPVIGGNGVFRFAKGYAQVRTYFYDPVAQNATGQYDLYVYLYY